jgi:hypothetical protein
VNDRTEIELGMSNCDNSIDEGLDEALRSGNVFGRHAGWNFNGLVYFEDGLFREEVYRYGSLRKVVSAPTLRELMDEVNSQFGSD